MTSRPPRPPYVTALLAPVEARSPDALLGVGWPAGAALIFASACARVPVVPRAETAGAGAAGAAAVFVGAGNGLSAAAVPDAGFS